MPTFQSLLGQQFGRLTVQERGPNSPSGRVRWWCLCICGTKKLMIAQQLKKGVDHCGCLLQEKIGAPHRTHGKRHTPEYIVYAHIRSRCFNPHDKSYKDYGGRGITIIWTSFEDFLRDVGPRPSPKHSIERIDNNGPYSRENCIWATRKQQNNNKRTTIYIEEGGISILLTEFAQRHGLTYLQGYGRYTRGTLFYSSHSRTP